MNGKKSSTGRLFEQRERLTPYSKALFGDGACNVGEKDKAQRFGAQSGKHRLKLTPTTAPRATKRRRNIGTGGTTMSKPSPSLCARSIDNRAEQQTGADADEMADLASARQSLSLDQRNRRSRLHARANTSTSSRNWTWITRSKSV